MRWHSRHSVARHAETYKYKCGQHVYESGNFEATAYSSSFWKVEHQRRLVGPVLERARRYVGIGRHPVARHAGET